MSEKVEIEYVDTKDYRIYNVAIEWLAKVITELGYAISNFRDLEDHGFDMDSYKLQDAMVDIATVFANERTKHETSGLSGSGGKRRF